ncbi:hypothetical protein [Natrinema sp. SYSU A 869]|uniref:hypothetical protein n=1 Tax=Natrinema sp. SYSU A 869 TaxID=2871694 RepID=UPI001CA3CE37|nr:hypothetical protein [Natrinema sp. SYSU A 869]
MAVEESSVTAVVTWVMSEERESNGEIRLTADGDVDHVGGYTDVGLQAVCEWNDDGELVAGSGTA